MKRSSLLVIFLTLSLLLSFCKKSDEEQGSIIGKWLIDSVQVVGRPYNEEVMLTIYRNAGENYYFDFRADSVQIYWSSTNYITKYSLIKPSAGKTLLQFDQSYAADTVLKLTNHNMVLTSRQGGRSLYFFSR